LDNLTKKKKKKKEEEEKEGKKGIILMSRSCALITASSIAVRQKLIQQMLSNLPQTDRKPFQIGPEQLVFS
jgi:hypothetical protein